GSGCWYPLAMILTPFAKPMRTTEAATDRTRPPIINWRVVGSQCSTRPAIVNWVASLGIWSGFASPDFGGHGVSFALPEVKALDVQLERFPAIGQADALGQQLVLGDDQLARVATPPVPGATPDPGDAVQRERAGRELVADEELEAGLVHEIPRGASWRGRRQIHRGLDARGRHPEDWGRGSLHVAREGD